MEIASQQQLSQHTSNALAALATARDLTDMVVETMGEWHFELISDLQATSRLYDIFQGHKESYLKKSHSPNPVASQTIDIGSITERGHVTVTDAYKLNSNLYSRVFGRCDPNTSTYRSAHEAAVAIAAVQCKRLSTWTKKYHFWRSPTKYLDECSPSDLVLVVPLLLHPYEDMAVIERQIRDEAVIAERWQIEHDDYLSGDYTATDEEDRRDKPNGKGTKAGAEDAAKSLFGKDESFIFRTRKEWAKEIAEKTGLSCSPALVSKLDQWKNRSAMKKGVNKKRATIPGKKARVASLTDHTLDNTPLIDIELERAKSSDSFLNQLIVDSVEEGRLDPSPTVKKTTRSPRQHKNA